MGRPPTREPIRGPKEEKSGGLRDCVEKSLGDLSTKNVISALNLAFVKCYLGENERVASKSASGEAVTDYMPMFSRHVTVKLYEALDCRKIVDGVNSYVKSLYEEVSKLFDASFLVEAKLESRLTIWVSTPTLPLEVNISWDPVLNVPFIPSSSLKGAVRAYIESYSGSNQAILSLKKKADILFGSDTGGLGLVHFFDGYPIGCGEDGKLLEPDVITPHYSEVKGSIDEASARPVPIVFPTIARGVKFGVIVGIDYCDESGSMRLSNDDLINLLEALKGAMSAGIGAKTSVGYGRLTATPHKLEPKNTGCGAGREATK